MIFINNLKKIFFIIFLILYSNDLLSSSENDKEIDDLWNQLTSSKPSENTKLKKNSKIKTKKTKKISDNNYKKNNNSIEQSKLIIQQLKKNKKVAKFNDLRRVKKPKQRTRLTNIILIFFDVIFNPIILIIIGGGIGYIYVKYTMNNNNINNDINNNNNINYGNITKSNDIMNIFQPKTFKFVIDKEASISNAFKNIFNGNPVEYTFEMDRSPGDGSCGYHSIKIPRQDVFDNIIKIDDDFQRFILFVNTLINIPDNDIAYMRNIIPEYVNIYKHNDENIEYIIGKLNKPNINNDENIEYIISELSKPNINISKDIQNYKQFFFEFITWLINCKEYSSMKLPNNQFIKQEDLKALNIKQIIDYIKAKHQQLMKTYDKVKNDSKSSNIKDRNIANNINLLLDYFYKIPEVLDYFNNPEEYKKFFQIKIMNSHIWATKDILIFAVNQQKKNLFIWDRNENKLFSELILQPNRDEVHILFSGGNHYDGLRVIEKKIINE